jgi:undecaprenyl-diphosphatase
MDLTVLTFFNQTLANPWLDGVVLGITTIGFLSLPLLGFLLLARQQERPVGVAILVGVVVGIGLALIFQYLSMRPRPDFARHILPPPNFPAYPSGHATAAFSTALIIGLAYRRRLWWVVGLTGASLIALSRVYLGYHYPSDIISGIILGMAVGAGSYGLIVPRQTLLERCQWLLWLQVAIALLVTQMAYLNILPLYLLDWPMADKVLHLLLIGSIAFWLNLWLKGRTVAIGRWAIPLAVLIPFTIALAEEIAQAFSPLRTASLWDLSSDAIGLLLFWWLSQKLLEAGLNTSSPIQPEQSPSH